MFDFKDSGIFIWVLKYFGIYIFFSICNNKSCTGHKWWPLKTKFLNVNTFFIVYESIIFDILNYICDLQFHHVRIFNPYNHFPDFISWKKIYIKENIRHNFPQNWWVQAVYNYNNDDSINLFQNRVILSSHHHHHRFILMYVRTYTFNTYTLYILPETNLPFFPFKLNQ